MLIKNARVDSDFPDEMTGEVYFPLFKRDISVDGFTEESLAYAQACAELLINLSEPLITSLCQASIRYCQEFLETIDEPLQEFPEERSVLDHITPGVLIISDEDTEPVINLELNCSWEPEHGMQWIIRGDKVRYVGPFYGENPFDDFSKPNQWNFA